jgi:ribosomal protein S3
MEAFVKEIMSLQEQEVEIDIKPIKLSELTCELTAQEIGGLEFMFQFDE